MSLAMSATAAATFFLLLAHAVPAAQRGFAFGVHRAFDNAGAVIGPLLAAALLAWQVPIREILLWAAVPGALTVALTLVIREPDVIEVPKASRPEWAWATLPPAFMTTLVAVVLPKPALTLIEPLAELSETVVPSTAAPTVSAPADDRVTELVLLSGPAVRVFESE